MEIIILFAIIGIIGSVLKNAAVKTQQPPPIVYRKPFQGFQETTTEPASLEGISLESGDTERNRQEDRFPVSDPYTAVQNQTGFQAGSTDTFASFLEESEPLQVESLDGTQVKQHKLDFSEGGILSGIILSEVLGPPKALREQKR
jgi:hypothetical protein